LYSFRRAGAIIASKIQSGKSKIFGLDSPHAAWYTPNSAIKQ
jgi:hypothetical protein